jgi:Prokaryotic membrane lipoprotein lipid attachment site
MRKIPAIIFAFVATFALSACNQQPEAAKPQAEVAPQVAPMPTNPADKTAWKQYLVSVVTANMQGVKTNHPYMYFVPGGDDDAAKADRQNQLDNVKNVVARGVLPGNLMAFGGPDSKATADIIVQAFAGAQAGALKDVIVLFIGAAGDLDTVKQAVTASGAEVRFVEAK